MRRYGWVSRKRVRCDRVLKLAYFKMISTTLEVLKSNMYSSIKEHLRLVFYVCTTSTEPLSCSREQNTKPTTHRRKTAALTRTAASHWSVASFPDFSSFIFSYVSLFLFEDNLSPFIAFLAAHTKHLSHFLSLECLSGCFVGLYTLHYVNYVFLWAH